MPVRSATSPQLLYEQIAAEITQLIKVGTIRPGDRITSVRRMSAKWSVSIPTVLQAYRLLEARRIIEARPQSGFYAHSLRASETPTPKRSTSTPVASEVTTGDLIMRCLEMVTDAKLIPLGTALPDPDLLPSKSLARCLGRAARRSLARTHPASMSAAGTIELRTEIARRVAAGGSVVSAEDVVVTCGGSEALALCLRTLTQPGDTVAVESPTWFGTLQVLDVLGLKALEIPVDSEQGMSLDVLSAALERGGVAAVVVTPTCQNPIGTVMSAARKRQLVELLARHGVRAIEDDTYGELAYAAERPRLLQSFDESGLIISCGSFSKTLAPGYRLGWTVPRGLRDRVLHYKLATTVSTAVPTQLAVADYLANGGYESYLRSLRRTFQTNVDRFRYEIAGRFPRGTRISRPAGGFLLWVELPESTNTVELQRRGVARGLSIAPGAAFSASGSYGNCLRINAGYQWSNRIGEALDLLARLIRECPS